MGIKMIVTTEDGFSVDVVIEFSDPDTFMGSMTMHKSMWHDDAEDMIRIARASGMTIVDKRPTDR